MSQSNDLTAISHNIDSIGKLFSDSKTRHTWAMDIDGETQVLVVTASWNSGKFVVELNGFERFHQIVSGVFMYSFKFRNRFFKVQQLGENLNLLIDTVPFSQYTAKAKAAQAQMLKSFGTRKEKEVVLGSSESPKSNKSSSPEPFSGNLAKRLGKKEEYVAQTDEDDFFSAPVEIKSFVVPDPVASMTVIPNLIEFSEAPSPATKPIPRVPILALPDEALTTVTPATGPVTPRDQISPSKLVNPFAAFDSITDDEKPRKPLLDDSAPQAEQNPFSM